MELRLNAEDWRRLRRLRGRFLTDASENYWKDARDLELYDAVYAQRIGWKWHGALAALAGWKPVSGRLLDWGCGTGIASRVVAEWSGIREAELFDQSPMAMAFARERHRSSGIHARPARMGAAIAPGTLLLISHVIGELKDEELAALAELAGTAEELIWVEPGSREISRRLSGVREALFRAGHRMIGPCTHDRLCPMLEPENERHWCHFFATPPTGVFQSQFWREVSREAEIDLRSLPYSFLASSRLTPPIRTNGAERLIGHPRELKAHCKLLCCGIEGLRDRTLQKRDAPELYRRIVKKSLGGKFVWQIDSGKPDRIRGGTPL